MKAKRAQTTANEHERQPTKHDQVAGTSTNDQKGRNERRQARGHTTGGNATGQQEQWQRGQGQLQERCGGSNRNGGSGSVGGYSSSTCCSSSGKGSSGSRGTMCLLPPLFSFFISFSFLFLLFLVAFKMYIHYFNKKKSRAPKVPRYPT